MAPIDVRVTSNRQIAEGTFAMRFQHPELAQTVLPGQFINILVDTHYDPLLRRPYSISNVYGDECEILFTVVGKGTGILAAKREGDTINILGPLGNTFGYGKDFATALILAGGIGVAPFPMLTRELQKREKIVFTFLGARSKSRLVTQGLVNVRPATDDGSEGFHGNVVSCLDDFLSSHTIENPRIFACGPNAMLRAVQEYSAYANIPAELSLESEMACGIGICQGCPIEQKEGERKYALVCCDGPCFEAGDVIFHEHHHV